ncbi:MAG: quinolinate synthase NadA [Actinobacteria bacterium]|nr:quinolinate synthase NadA [Actinomycetota bacterium]
MDRLNSSKELVNKIDRLKVERNAVILAHNYQIDEVQDIADYVGDSLGLSRQAASTDAEVIVFCGVHFMAETAAILSLEKTVILPDMQAGCPMADMVDADDVRELRAVHPGLPVVCYVNSSAEVKAESDVCCTSSNAVAIFENVDSDQVIFVPDQFLGGYAARLSGKKVVPWKGFCPTHMRILPQDIVDGRNEHPEAMVVVHPECRAEVIELADAAKSTGGILDYCRASNAKEFIIGTEIGLIHRLRLENPDKKFYPANPLAICPNMKLITLEKVVWALEDMENIVTVEAEIARKARRAIEAMVAVG